MRYASLQRLRGSLCTLIMSCMVLCWHPIRLQSESSQDRRLPNVLFIMADDLGWGDLGSYGQQRIMTPNLDRLASEGMRFTQVYAGSTVCAPSRSVLMTGLHTGHTRIRGNARVPLLPEDRIVAEYFKSAGYRTGIIGKWGLGEPGTTGIPTSKGFDYFFGYLNQRHAHNYYPSYLWKNEQQISLPHVAARQQRSKTARHGGPKP
ncbi:MAG: sulfatase-like hydrolase/transferase [Limisphaerales bacterium]